jgi:hypothetical protein
MNADLSDQYVPLRRPLIAVGICWAAITLLFAVCTPLIDDGRIPEPEVFFLGGVGYGLVLSVFVMGLMVAPKSATRWCFIGIGGLQLVMLSFIGAIVVLAAQGAEMALRLIDYGARPLLAVSLVCLATAGGISVWGWVRYFRRPA